MRAQDIIRAVLDLLDHNDEQQGPTVKVEMPPEQGESSASRFKQILAMLDKKSHTSIANSPNEVIAPITSVTSDAGGGINGPKHPADIRGEHPSLYPGQVWGDR
jgi:hypothetical protein